MDGDVGAGMGVTACRVACVEGGRLVYGRRCVRRAKEIIRLFATVGRLASSFLLLSRSAPWPHTEQLETSWRVEACELVRLFFAAQGHRVHRHIDAFHSPLLI